MKAHAVLLAVGVALALAAPARADDVVADDEIVQGMVCTGFDCINDEVFGTDTLRLKENNTRLTFDDTTAAGGSANDWEVTANDSGSGGQSFLGVTDRTSTRVPLRVLANSPTDALVLAPGGLATLGRGTLVQRVNGAVTELPGAVDEGALLTALKALPLSTYELAGDPSNARHSGPAGTAFNSAFGLGGGTDVAVSDATGVALTAVKQLAAVVAVASRGAAGPAGATGDRGPQGEPGAPGTNPASLAAFNARLDRLERAQTTERRRLASLRKRIGG